MPPPNKKREKRERPQEGEQVIAFTLDGIDYRVDWARIENRHELDLWREAHLTIKDLFDAIQSGAPFAMAGLMFLSERQAGKRTRYDALLDAVDRFDLDIEFTQEDDGPEA